MLKTEYLIQVGISGHRPQSPDPRENGREIMDARVIHDGNSLTFTAGNVRITFDANDMMELLDRLYPESAKPLGPLEAF